MGIYRLNHAVLWVRDVNVSIAFYRDVLGFEVVTQIPDRAAFMRVKGSTNDHDLGLFAVGADAEYSAAGAGSVGLYHLAWEVETLADMQEFAQRLEQAGALAGSSDHRTTKSLYGKDPDALEFEIAWIVPADLLDEETIAGRLDTGPLNLAHEIARYGGDTAGGVGISRLVAR
jgi:catechol-2,3-dioxygenase